MKNIYFMGLIFISLSFLVVSCKPQQKAFQEMSKNSEEYRKFNENKKLIPYLDDVYEGKD